VSVESKAEKKCCDDISVDIDTIFPYSEGRSHGIFVASTTPDSFAFLFVVSKKICWWADLFFAMISELENSKMISEL